MSSLIEYVKLFNQLQHSSKFSTLILATIFYHNVANNKLMGSNHQTTKLVFPNFLHDFFSVGAVEKKFDKKYSGFVVWWFDSMSLLKIMYSEKATKFRKIFT